MPLLARRWLSDFWKLHRLTNHRNQRIVVVRALPGLGDFLCAVPALRALRQLYTEAHIALVGLASTQQLVERFDHLVDELIPFPGFPGIVEEAPNVDKLPGFLQEMQSRAFDLAIQMHGSGSFINPFTLLLGARRTVGYDLPPTELPDSHVCNGVFIPYPEELHEVYRNLGLVKVCEFAGEQKWEQDPERWGWDDRIEFPLNSSDHKDFERLAESYGLEPGQYVCVHAGASVPERRWSPDRFAAVGAWLREEGYKVVLTGTAAESEVTARVAAQLGQPLIDLTGKTNLGALALVVKHARLLVCNDTGVSHVAAAMETPSVVLCINSDKRRWAPLNRTRHKAISSKSGTSITVAEVLQAVREMSGGGQSGDHGRLASDGKFAPRVFGPEGEESYEFG